jgi:hypothetical protein
MQGRIWFEGNPWPHGHAIKALDFSLLLDARGIGLLLNLESDDYYAEDPTYWDDDHEDEEVDSGWQSKVVWGNYHSCRLSNTYWGIDSDTVPRLGSRDALFDLAHSLPLQVAADPVAFGAESDKDYDDHAFHIYLTGHDAVAAHDILIERQDNGLFAIKWSGLIAEAYTGSNDFNHRFRAEASDVPFNGFLITVPRPDGVHKPQPPSADAREEHARSLAARYIHGAADLRFLCGRGFDPDRLVI